METCRIHGSPQGFWRNPTESLGTPCFSLRGIPENPLESLQIFNNPLESPGIHRSSLESWESSGFVPLYIFEVSSLSTFMTILRPIFRVTTDGRTEDAASERAGVNLQVRLTKLVKKRTKSLYSTVRSVFSRASNQWCRYALNSSSMESSLSKLEYGIECQILNIAAYWYPIKQEIVGILHRQCWLNIQDL